MNNFCKNCVNMKVPSSLKEKFNVSYNKTFLECPTNDEKVVGCLIKERLKIDWGSFCTWLNDHKNLTADEAIEMAKLGFITQEKKKGRKK